MVRILQNFNCEMAEKEGGAWQERIGVTPPPRQYGVTYHRLAMFNARAKAYVDFCYGCAEAYVARS